MGKHVNNKNNLYKLNERTIDVSATENHSGTIYNKQYDSETLLGFKNLDNSRLNFRLQLFPAYLYSMANRSVRYQNSQHENLWYIENTDRYSISITKIVLNAR